MLRRQYIELRDAADWNAPGLTGWNGPVQGYPNRTPPWPEDAFDRFAGGVMRTSVRPEASWAAECREIDVEAEAARARDVPAFLLEREQLGHADGGVYCCLFCWPAVHANLISARIGPSRVRIRIADWTGVPRVIDLGDGYVSWAHQFENVPALGIDRSAVWGPGDWSRS